MKIGMTFAIGSAVAMASFGAPVSAAQIQLVVNGSFENVGVTDKTSFASADVAGWTIPGNGNLTFLDTPGTADNPNKYLAVYGPFPTVSPDGGNFFESDGDPNYRAPISQTISGLTIGQSYTLNFYQAAGQQLGFTGPTTERWQVTFGDQTQLSSLFSLPEGGVGDWQQQTMTFVATSTSQVLTFLAAGTPGGAPPISFLDGVSMTASVPEPASWGLMILGFGAIGGALRRRRQSALTA